MERWIDQELMPGETVAQVYEIAKYPATLICNQRMFYTFHFLCKLWIRTNAIVILSKVEWTLCLSPLSPPQPHFCGISLLTSARYGRGGREGPLLFSP